MALNLVIGAKGSDEILFTSAGESVTITGLEPGTVVAAGDYQAWNVDPDGKLKPSAKVDVPGFTVEQEEAPAPADVTATATEDGATVSGK